MRISTSLTFEFGTEAITRQQSEMLKTQQQLATGRRMVSASDDPVAAARSVELSSTIARNDRYIAGQTDARNSLALTEGTLGSVSDTLQDVRMLLVQAGNAAFSDSDRAYLAVELRNRSAQLLALANARDADGRYLFAGYRDSESPFTATASGVVYQGDEGRRELPVADGRSLVVSANGAEVFDRVAGGNGVFSTAAGAVNTGTGIITVGQVDNPALLDGHAYELVFRVTGGVTTFDVLDTTAGLTVSSGNAYTSGAAISVAGMQAQVEGAPADADRFTLSPSQKTSVFTMIAEAVDLLESAVSAPAARARLSTGLSRSLANMDRALDSVMLARTEAGSGLAELDRQQTAASGVDLVYRKELSELQDLDYTKAITELTRRQTQLEAAQKAFVHVTGRSLFDIL